MAEKEYYIGSLGPFFYDDSELIEDPLNADESGVFATETRRTLATAGQILVKGTPTADNDVVRFADIKNLIPPGMIMMWNGIVATIPTGWQFCDGTNGTPDLRSKFILCAGTKTVGTVGANSLAGVESLSIAAANLPSHSHSISSDGVHGNHVTANAKTGAAGADKTIITTLGDSAAHTHGGATGTVGSGTALNVSPPYYTLAYIMKLAY